MPYLVQYRYSYKQKIGSSSETVQVTLSQNSSFAGSGTPTITTLVAGKPAFKVSVIDNDRDKFKVIRGKQAALIFKPQPGITASTFSTGPDDEWIVEAIVVSTGFVLFKGFLWMDDHQQSFLPISNQYDIELTATDNLGTLKEVPLTDDSGTYIRGYKKKIEVIAQCLRKTGLQLDIMVRDTWMEESQSSFMTGLNYSYYQMKTFEKDINESVDCYQALEIICRYHLSIKQYDGKWWVENIDEKTANDAYVFRFDYTGAYIDQPTPTTHVQQIGKTQDLKLINKDAILNYVRPVKFTRITYDFDYPKEIVENISFTRGAINGSITVPTGYVAYDVDDWTLEAPYVGGTLGKAYIRRKIEDGYEKERVLIVDLSSTAPGNWNNLSVNTPIPIVQNDKFNFNLDMRFVNEVSGSGNYWNSCVLLRLDGDDGSIWLCGTAGVNALDEDKWTSFPTGIPFVPNRTVWSYQDKADTQIDWTSLSCIAPPAPVSGELTIAIIVNSNVSNPRHFANMQFQYIPYINGTYERYSGQSYAIEQSGNYKANIDENILTADSPRKLFKGAQFKLVAGKYVLTERWFAGGDLLNQAIIPPYPPADDYLHPFGWLQVYSIWNQHNRRMIEISGSVKGLRLGTSTVPDLIDVYKINATTDAGTDVTGDKEFQLTSSEQDGEKEEWNLTMSESFDSVIGKDYTTPLAFKYEEAGL